MDTNNEERPADPAGASHEAHRHVDLGRGLASRRSVLAGGAGAALAAGAAAAVPTPAAAKASSAGHHRGFETRIEVASGVRVNVADLDGGRKGTLVLIPGWPLKSTMLENTTLFLADQGYRAVALDLRGFGKSDAPYAPYSYDVWCADIRTVFRAMSLRDVTLVGHSMGGAVALRYAARYRSRVSKLVVAEPAAPRFVYGPKSPDLAVGLAGPISGYAEDRSQVVRALTKTFFSTHTDASTDPFLQFFERQGLDQASLVASRAGLIALRDTDLTPDPGPHLDTDAGLPRPPRPDRAPRPRASPGRRHQERAAGDVHHRRLRALHRRAGQVPPRTARVRPPVQTPTITTAGNHPPPTS